MNSTAGISLAGFAKKVERNLEERHSRDRLVRE
jgi:hypothetical protein